MLRGVVTIQAVIAHTSDVVGLGRRPGYLPTRRTGRTTLTGQVIDQAELFGLLARLRDLGATLLALEPLVDDARAPG